MFGFQRLYISLAPRVGSSPDCRHAHIQKNFPSIQTQELEYLLGGRNLFQKIHVQEIKVRGAEGVVFSGEKMWKMTGTKIAESGKRLEIDMVRLQKKVEKDNLWTSCQDMHDWVLTSIYRR